MKMSFKTIKKVMALGLTFTMMGSAIAGPISSPNEVFAEDKVKVNSDLEETVVTLSDEEAEELFVEQTVDIYGQEQVDEVVKNRYDSQAQAGEITEKLYTSSMSSDKTYSKYTTTYLYNKLPSAKKQYYNKLYSVSLSYLTNSTNVNRSGNGYYVIQVPFSSYGLSLDEAIDVVEIFTYTNPQFFFYDSGYSMATTYVGLLVNDGFANGATRIAARDKIISKVNSAIKSIGKVSDQTKRARLIHNWLCDNVSYHSNSYDQGVYSTFVLKQTVCAGYAEGFAMIANALGLKALSVTSILPNSYSGHEWNQVYIDGKWYIIDVTWDDEDYGIYDFFKKSENYVFSYNTYSRQMHTLEDFWKTIPVPDCLPKYSGGSTPSTKTNAMYRLYNPNSGEHFYTASSTERENLKKAGWQYEGVAWNAPTKGSPVYRMYNANAGDHHYTTSSAEKNNLLNAGWKYEGVGWYSGGPSVLYRVYNSNAVSGSHHYTKSQNEVINLVNTGWQYEGTAWYGY